MIHESVIRLAIVASLKGKIIKSFLTRKNPYLNRGDHVFLLWLFVEHVSFVVRGVGLVRLRVGEQIESIFLVSRTNEHRIRFA